MLASKKNRKNKISTNCMVWRGLHVLVNQLLLFSFEHFWYNKAVYVENPSEDRRRNTNKRLRKGMEKNSQHNHTILNQSLVSVYNAFDQKVYACINVLMTYQSAWRSVNVLYKLFGTYMYMLVLRYLLVYTSWSYIHEV